jgi:hypothetical protein
MTVFNLHRFGPVLALAVVAAPVETSFAFSPEAQLQCTGDAVRLCSSDIPNIDRITACMKQQRSMLSAGCRDVMERDEAAAALQDSQTRAQKVAPVSREKR